MAILHLIKYLKIKRYMLYILLGMIVIFMTLKSNNKYKKSQYQVIPTYSSAVISNSSNVKENVHTKSEIRTLIIKQKIERLEKEFDKFKPMMLPTTLKIKPNYNIHIFYYAWYGNKEIDGKYSHWNHKYLENWKHDDKNYFFGAHNPPFDIGSNFYPLYDCYSSSDPSIVDAHFKLIKSTGIGVVVVSWTPPNFTDSPSDILPYLFKIASEYAVKITLHVEPYKGRNPANLINHLKMFLDQYGTHPALYKIKKPFGEKEVPVFYIYDSYLISPTAWKEILGLNGKLSVRNTLLDAVYLGLLVDIQHKYHIKKSQFDGFYTYFAINSFSYGSTWKNWNLLAKFAHQNNLIFIPSVGPGYVDTQVRPWNIANMRHRHHGHYYNIAWRAALNSNAKYISITSFNEWHEGTQIEPAKTISSKGSTYLNYEPEGPYFYLNLTNYWVTEFGKVH